MAPKMALQGGRLTGHLGSSPDSLLAACMEMTVRLCMQAVLGEAALPTRSSFLQEVTLHYQPGVVVEGPAAVIARRTRFIWSLELNEEGCWQVIWKHLPPTNSPLSPQEWTAPVPYIYHLGR